MELTDKREIQGVFKKCSLSKKSKFLLKFGRNVGDAADGSLNFFTSIQELAERVVEREIYVKTKCDDRYPDFGYACTTSPNTCEVDDGCINSFIKQELTIKNTIIQCQMPAKIPPRTANVAASMKLSIKQEDNETAQPNTACTTPDNNVHIVLNGKNERFMSEHFNIKIDIPILKSSSRDICNIKSGRKHNLCRRMQVRTGEKRCNCDTCSKRKSIGCNPMKHKRLHNGDKPLHRNKGDEKVSMKGKLRMHINGHRPFSCNVCAASFKTVKMLRAHEFVHKGRKSYVCDVCKASFVLSGSLKFHKRMHRAEKPFGCNLCDAMFRNGGNLKQHIKLEHSVGKAFC